ncbi:MAG TPA: helix-turn-helix domain-containing protein [Rubrobacteraceae bacterium]|nr:helix-turn-helix domain-containing protein [Rubrobacteraceae bacterium]
MRAYSGDLRTKIVQAVEQRGMPKEQAARLFGVSVFSVKRYARLARQGLSLAPGKGGGRPPKSDEAMRKLLEEDVEKRPAATVAERRRFLENLTDNSLSEPTLRRLLKRMGFSRKKGCGGNGTGRVLEGRLEGDGRPEDGSPSIRVRRQDGHQHLALRAVCLGSQRPEGAVRCRTTVEKTTRSWQA